MNIDSVFKFVNFISNKVQSGTVQPANFNLMAARAQMELYEKEVKVWQDSQQITDSMKTFLKNTILNPVSTTGKANYPGDYVHTSTARSYYVRTNGNSVEVPVKEVDNDEYGQAMVSEVAPPTKRFPVCTYYDTYIQFLPKDIGFVFLDYFRLPATPVWAYTIINARPVYDPAASTDIEFPDQDFNEIVFIITSYLGINIRENQLIQYSEMMKQESTPSQ